MQSVRQLSVDTRSDHQNTRIPYSLPMSEDSGQWTSLKGTDFSPYISQAKSTGIQPLRVRSFKLTHHIYPPCRDNAASGALPLSVRTRQIQGAFQTHAYPSHLQNLA